MDGGSMAYHLIYADVSIQHSVGGTPGTWQYFDITSSIDDSRVLIGVAFWGNAGIRAFIDDIVLDDGRTIPEPAGAILIIGAIGMMITLTRRHRVDRQSKHRAE